MGWLILGIVVLLCFLPLGVKGVYNQKGAGLYLLIGPLAFLLYPQKKSKKKNKKSNTSEKKAKVQKSNKGSLTDFLDVAQLVIDFLADFRRKLRVNNLEMKVILADSDPASLSTKYGYAWAALGNLIPQMERVFVIKKRNVEVLCDYTAEKMVVFAQIVATITLGRLIGILGFHSVRWLKKYFNYIKKSKGGAVS